MTGCAPPKAYIDHSTVGGILWPGGSAKPRIKYLWNLQVVAGRSGQDNIVSLLAGSDEFDFTDPAAAPILLNPYGVFCDEKDRLYITDTVALRVTVIDMKTMESFHITDTDSDSFVSPLGVVADNEGRIYVSDSELRKVSVFNDKGKFMYFFEGDFKRPTGLAINAGKKAVYVVDTLEHKIYQYGYDGKRTGSVGGRGDDEGLFNYPTNIAVDKEGYIYVTDAMNFRVQIFDPSGSYVRDFGTYGDDYFAFDKIKGIAVDGEGHIYVVDAQQDTVKIFNKEGRLLLFFGQQGHYYGEFFLPTGIYIDNKNRIYVADSINMRVQAFQFLGGD